MEKTIFDIFAKNQVHFCAEPGIIETSSVDRMKQCFDVFHPYKSSLFYRLNRNCKRYGYLDRTDCLIQPEEDYHHMVCLALLNSDEIECPSWIEENEFKYYLENGELGELVKEVCEAGIDSGEDYDYRNYDYRDDDEVLSGEDSEEDSGEYSGESYSSSDDYNAEKDNHSAFEKEKYIEEVEIRSKESYPEELHPARDPEFSSTDSDDIIEIIIEESTISDDQIYANSKGKSEESSLSSQDNFDNIDNFDNFVPGISESTSVSSVSSVSTISTSYSISEYSEESSSSL